MSFLRVSVPGFFCAVMVFAQGFSSLPAHVTDASGAAIVGATVEATNLDTSAKRNSRSDGTCTVTLNQMLPGRYSIVASMAGFTSETSSTTEESGVWCSYASLAGPCRPGTAAFSGVNG